MQIRKILANKVAQDRKRHALGQIQLSQSLRSFQDRGTRIGQKLIGL